MAFPSPTPSIAKARLSAAITDFYNLRAPTYDSESDRFHVNLAADLITLAAASASSPPLKILDLCCGTGLVSFAARSHFGPDVVIHGVDQSTVSIDVVRKKAAASGDVRMRFFEGSATALSPLELEKESYDLIACCSALVLLLEDLPTTVIDWTSYLKPGGVLVFDVPAPGTQIVGTLAYQVIAKRGVLAIRRGEIEDKGKVRKFIGSVGLECRDVFRTRVYKTETFRVEDAGEKWHGLMRHRMFDVSALNEEQKEEAKKEFVEKVKRIADDDGVVRDEVSLLVGIAVKGK